MAPDKAAAIWDLALCSLEQDCPAMLLYVLESKGSSPGRQGFFMVVNARGEMEGSIGGGIMEHKFAEMAVHQLRERGHRMSLRRQVHDDSAAKDRSGMICSGEQTILFYAFIAEDSKTLCALQASIQAAGNGTLTLSPAGIGFSTGTPQRDFYFYKGADEDWRYEEKTGYKNRMYIVGAGHCSLALSKLMRMMDFYITVLDHRPLLPTMASNEYAHERIVVEDYAMLGQHIPAGSGSNYVVLMTLGYRTDDKAMRALMDTDFRYLGLLGSKAKVGRMLQEYRSEGISEDRLRRIHTPAGLSIHSRTPEEIAISIAAQIISVKNAALE